MKYLILFLLISDIGFAAPFRCKIMVDAICIETKNGICIDSSGGTNTHYIEVPDSCLGKTNSGWPLDHIIVQKDMDAEIIAENAVKANRVSRREEFATKAISMVWSSLTEAQQNNLMKKILEHIK